MNLMDFYNQNEDFKRYVDRYCFKHNKSVEEALKDSMVRIYFDYLQEN